MKPPPYLFVIISPVNHQGGGRLGVELTPLLPEHLAGCLFAFLTYLDDDLAGQH